VAHRVVDEAADERRATPDSTGVTNPTQWEASSGVNTGTVRMNRPPSPVTSAYRRIMSA
jgi:hypothetical protein